MAFSLRNAAAILVLSISSVAAQATEIQFWHSDTVWAGQGMCAASFTFDSGGMGAQISRLRVTLAAVDGAGHNLDTVVLEVPEFGTSNADRYASALWESDAACDDELTLVVTSANAQVDHQRRDLLKTQQISVRSFKPFAIQISGQAGGISSVPGAENNSEFAGAECDSPLEPAQAQAIWDNMRANSQAYLRQCVADASQMAIEYGGQPPAQARRQAEQQCRAEIQEVTACMAQAGARANACICGVDA